MMARISPQLQQKTVLEKWHEKPYTVSRQIVPPQPPHRPRVSMEIMSQATMKIGRIVSVSQKLGEVLVEASGSSNPLSVIRFLGWGRLSFLR